MEITKMKTDSTGESLGAQYPNVNYCKSINLSLETLIRFFDFKPVFFLFVPNDCFRYAGIMQGDVLKVEISNEVQVGDKVLLYNGDDYSFEIISSKLCKRLDGFVWKVVEVNSQSFSESLMGRLSMTYHEMKSSLLDLSRETAERILGDLALAFTSNSKIMNLIPILKRDVREHDEKPVINTKQIILENHGTVIHK